MTRKTPPGPANDNPCTDGTERPWRGHRCPAPSMEALLGGLPAAAFLRRPFERLEASASGLTPTFRSAVAVGTLARLWAPHNSGGSITLAQLWGDDTVHARCAAWARSLSPAHRRQICEVTQELAELLAEDLRAAVEARRTGAFVDLALRRDGLESAAWVVRTITGANPRVRLTDVDALVAELGDGVRALRDGREWAVQRLTEVGWQEPRAWWGVRDIELEDAECDLD